MRSFLRSKRHYGPGLFEEAVPLRGTRAKVSELPPNLDIATEEFRNLLRRTGYPERIHWIKCHDLILRSEGGAYVRVRDKESTFDHSREVYDHAVRNGFAIAIEAWAATEAWATTDVLTFAEVWAVTGASEAEYLMMSGSVVKYSVPVEKRVATEVTSGIRWSFLSLNYVRG